MSRCCNRHSHRTTNIVDLDRDVNGSSFHPRVLGPSILFAAALAFRATVPVLADAVTQTLTPGLRTASVSNLV